MKHTHLFLFLFLASVLTTYGQTFTLKYAGTDRSYIVHLPSGYSTLNNYPLVFNFHGLTSTASQQQAYTQMDKTADAEKFIVVYPDGVNNSWNAGINNGDVDDIGFINVLADTLIKKYKVDTHRIYATGLSMGGFFSYRLACELSHRIAAVASVAGTMTSITANNCKPGRSVPVLHIHGTNDATVNYNGGTGFYGAESVTTFWKSLNKCSGSPDTVHVPNINTKDNSTVDLVKYQQCEEAAQVWLYKIYNGGHTWPEGAININGLVTNRDFNASQEIWNFFERFSLPVVTELKDKQENVIEVYPVPAGEFLNIKTSAAIRYVSISDLSGKVLIRQLSGTESIDIAQLHAGMYLLHLQTEEDRELVTVFIKE